MRSTILAVVFFTAGLSTVLAIESFALDDFLKGTFADKKWNGTWYDDKSILYQTDKGYELFDVTTKKHTTLLTKKALQNYAGASITFSFDKKYVLVKYNAVAVYRHSSEAKFALLKQSDGSEVVLPAEFKDKLLQTCRFSPVENALIAVKDNNIYYISALDTTPAAKQVTNDGKPHIVYNGVPDWIYEEEVIGGDTALWASPVSNKFIYAKFDDIEVKEFTYQSYGEPGEFKDQYPTMHTIRYPKVGQKNPKFSLRVYDPTTNGDAELTLKFAPGTVSAHYVVYDVAWWTDSKVLISYTNREQNQGYLESCDVKTLACVQLTTQTEAAGWLDVQPVHVLDDKKFVESYVLKGFDALRQVEVGTSVVLKSISLGNMTVTSIYSHVDKVLYFEGTEASHHDRQHVFSINLDTASDLKCITCDFNVFNQSCTHARAVFSPGMTYMTRICAGPGPTFVDIVELKALTKAPVVWLDNADLRLLLKDKNMPATRDVVYDIPGTKLQAKVRLLLPPDIAGDSGIKYPMMVNVYAGPNSNQIVDTYSVGLQHYLVTNRKYIYAFIDGRGSGKRGRTLMHSVYKRLGQFEIEDQITITQKLRDEFDFIHPDKIGIWGWSYGGFATAHVTARDNGTFRCGVSVAPVTDFIYYDSIYTERYMGVYDDNNAAVKSAYEKTDVTKKAKDFKGKNFLLVHGNADDNVHYQQAMQLARALEKADVPFLQMSYPDEAHALSGVKQHLYHMLDAFWQEHLGEPTEKSSAISRLPPPLAMVMLVAIFWAMVF